MDRRMLTGIFYVLFLFIVWVINCNHAKAQSTFSQQSMINASYYFKNKDGDFKGLFTIHNTMG